jgi:hypothetical protein
MFLVFAIALLVGAALVMLVQPLCARMVLPALGGTPGVWNTCMVFFQAGLLAGYSYAHIAPRWLPGIAHRVLHVVVLAAAALTLPALITTPAAPPHFPALWLLGTLLAAVGLPYVMAASTGPLLQRWFAESGAPNPYVLYAASNAGSFLGILAYPFLVEPKLTLAEQAEAWRWGFIGLTGLTAASAVYSWVRRAPVTEARRGPAAPVRWPQRLRWLLLAFAPSSLLLSVTGYLTTDIAPVPLLWLAPLALYLLTFTLVFASRQIMSHQVLLRWQPAVLVVLMLVLLREANEPLLVVLGLHLAGFFWLTMVCHGELARTKPVPEHLTEFYLWLALGGVLGGAFNALVAPVVFTGYLEYPLVLVLIAALRPADLVSGASDSGMRSGAAPATISGRLSAWIIIPLIFGGITAMVPLLARWTSSDGTRALAYALPLIVSYFLQFNVRRFALALAAVFVASALDPGIHGPAAYRTRSFFGVHRVTTEHGMRRLIHGNTQHGVQFLDSSKRRIPQAYYHPTGPIGRLLTAWNDDPRRRRVALVGLGAGALAAYAESEDDWTFFEIDPAVIHIARDTGLFTYLADSKGKIDILAGDARLTLQQSDETFGLLIIDAFGSDAIPLHLLTREAMDLYQSKLKPGGVLAVHISNRYVDLEPVLAQHAAERGWTCLIADDRGSSGYPGKSPSVWAFLAERRELIDLPNSLVQRAAADPTMRTWTDDYTNLLGVLRLGREE